MGFVVSSSTFIFMPNYCFPLVHPVYLLPAEYENSPTSQPCQHLILSDLLIFAILVTTN